MISVAAAQLKGRIWKCDDHAVKQSVVSADRQAALQATTRLEISMHIDNEHESATYVIIRYLPIQIEVRV